MESCHAQSHRLTFSSLNTKAFPHRKGMRANQFASLSRLITAWSLWGMPTEAAKYHMCKHVQTIAWRCHKRNPQYQSGKCSNTGAAVSGTFNAVTAVKWKRLERCWGGCDGCTACRLHCKISQSAWAANNLKIEGTLGKAEKLAWLSHASSEIIRTRGPIRLSSQQEYMRKPSTELYGEAVPVHQRPAKSRSHLIRLHERVSGPAGSLGEYPLQLVGIGK